MKKLTIIIPCYNAEPYIDELLKRLKPQMTDEVEVIVIDDGSRFPFLSPVTGIKTIRKANGGAASARNRGIDEAKGQYIAFIDADDLIPEYYVRTILDKIDSEHFDYCYMSWKTFGKGWKYEVNLKSIEDKFPTFNLCVWNRIYKRSMIGNVRFNESKAIAEDAEFIRDVKEKGKKKAYIPECMYFYRTGHGGNLSERFALGELDFDRIVYYIPHITKSDTSLISEIEEANKTAEVIVMTDKCELPLEEYAMVIKPQSIAGTELRGQQTSLFRKVPKPIKTQIVLYVGNTQQIGGIETFIYNFCREMHEYYDIMVVYTEHMDARQILRLSKYVYVCRNPQKTIICEILLNIRITDEVPSNIKYNRKVQMVHTCQMADSGKYHYKIVKGWDDIVFVSEVAAESFRDQVNSEYRVIHNLTDTEKVKKALVLVSATRLTYEKGEDRIYALAEALRNKNIPYIWYVFSPTPLKRSIPYVLQCPTSLDIRSYYMTADYVVQLSDKESFCYTIVEALELGIPVLTTGIDVLSEIGFKDKENGYILPFDMKDIDVERIYNNKPVFKPIKNNNKAIVEQWRYLLGDMTPTRSYKADEEMVKVVCIESYGDLELGREMEAGDIAVMRRDRAAMLINRGLVEKA